MRHANKLTAFYQWTVGCVNLYHWDNTNFHFIHSNIRLHFEKELRGFNLCHLEKMQNLTHYHWKIKIESCKKWFLFLTSKYCINKSQKITHCKVMRTLPAAPPPSWHDLLPQPPRMEWNPAIVKIILNGFPNNITSSSHIFVVFASSSIFSFCEPFALQAATPPGGSLRTGTFIQRS